jgi:hypothetical protein
MFSLRIVPAALFLSLFAGATVWLFAQAFQPEQLPVGAPMPELSFRTVAGEDVLRPDGKLHSIVVWFHSECVYCRSELDRIERELGRFGSTRLFLLSTEEALFRGGIHEEWPELTRSGNVTWGILGRRDFRDAFGTAVTPALFLFGPDGTLIKKFRGEVAPRFLLPEAEGVISTASY